MRHGGKNKKRCNKIGYRSATQARDALNELKHTGVKRWYKCPYCTGLFHLTSEDK